VAPGSPTIGAEIVHAIRSEQAVRLSDIVIRRTSLGALECPSETALAACARTAATELGWDEARREAEIAGVREVYRV
jgi:glycerol-3-phosphate dehydrogenase